MAGNKTGWIMLYSCWKGTFLRSWRPRTTFNSWGISSMATPSMQWAAVKTWRLEAGKYHTKPKLRRYFDIRLPPQWCVPLCIFSKDTWNIKDVSSRQVATCQGCLLGSLSWPPTILDPLLESSTSSLPQRHTWKRYLTLFGPGGGTLCPPCHVFAYNCSNTRTSTLKKLDFS